MEMKKVRLGDIGNIITGSTPSKKNPDNYGNYALWIKPTDINPEEKYTRFDHPLLAASVVKKHKDKLSLNDEELNLMTRVISSHMGIWNKDFNDNEVLPVPKDKYERFVHLCDYLSSKKFLNVDFDGIDIKY